MRIPRTARACLFACTVTLTGLCFGINHPAHAAPPLFMAAPGSPITVTGRPQNLAVGDVNNDGKPDLVIACADKQVAVMLGDGRGGFRPAPGSPIKLAASASRKPNESPPARQRWATSPAMATWISPLPTMTATRSASCLETARAASSRRRVP